MVPSFSEVAVTTSSVRVRALGTNERRVYRARGIERAEHRSDLNYSYLEGALIPAPPWTGLGRADHGTLPFPHEGTSPGETIDVLSAPPDLLNALRSLGVAQRDCPPAPREVYRQVLLDKLPLLSHLIESPGGLQVLGMGVRRGGMWSTGGTYVEGDGPPMLHGLHVDNLENKKPGERRTAARLLSINVGHGDRFFVFCSLTVDDLARAGIVAEPDYRSYPLKVLSRFPDLPVFKIRICPGEMYIAPTENLIHDGTSVGNLFQDVTMNIRGHFRVRGEEDSRLAR